MCLKEKYFAIKTSSTIFMYSMGSMEMPPILYQPLTPLISGASTKSPASAKTPIIHKINRKYGSLRKSRQSTYEIPSIRNIPIIRNIACFWKLPKFSSPIEELYREDNPKIDKSPAVVTIPLSILRR